ncbi:MAG: hypothetical protein ACKVS8_02075 [Phycisphaerales bacterium]
MLRVSLSRRCGCRCLLVAALAAGAMPWTVLGQPVAFEGLGFLDGFPQISVAWGISADGSTIVGESISGVSQPGTEAWRRVGSGTISPLGTLNPTFFSSAVFGVSGDGRYAAGQSLQVDGGINLYNVGVRCDTQGLPNPKWRSLGALPGAVNNSTAFAISADGSRLAGVAKSIVNNEETDQAFRYVVTSDSPFAGTMTGLGFLPGTTTSQGSAISADGNIVVGASLNPFTGFVHAFTWTAPGPLQALPEPPGMTGLSVASGISGDGSTIVGGYAAGGAGQRAVRWTSAYGGELLPELAGAPATPNSGARGASGDGRIIVGYATSNDPTADGEAVAWTYRGVMPIKAALTSAGVDTAGWSLFWANAVSADGRIVVGYGRDPQGRTQAWRAVLPDELDFNIDGVVNPDDLGDYITDYFQLDAKNEPVCDQCDFNLDRVLNPDDLGDFITAYFQFPF